MNLGATRHRAKYKSVCKYCGKEFMSKRRNKIVCYETICVRSYEHELNKKKAIKTAEKRRKSEIQYLEHCIEHERLHHTGTKPDQDKLDMWTKRLKELHG